MEFQEVYSVYSELKNTLEEKKQAIIKKDIEKLGKIDEICIGLCEKIKKVNIEDFEKNISQNQKEQLKELATKIKEIEESNKILIEHSLGVINRTLSGILNLVQPDKSSYNSKGASCCNDESLDISSVVEEA